jgi:hypothetical protein
MKETRKAGRIGLIPGTLVGTVAMPNGIASPNAGPLSRQLRVFLRPSGIR